MNQIKNKCINTINSNCRSKNQGTTSHKGKSIKRVLSYQSCKPQLGCSKAEGTRWQRHDHLWL